MFEVDRNPGLAALRKFHRRLVAIRFLMLRGRGFHLFLRLLGRIVKARKRSGRFYVLIAPPGGGNIGDQALCEAFFENVQQPVRLVVRTSGNIVVPKSPEHAVTELVFPNLVYGRGIRRVLDLFRLAAVLKEASGLFVVGADIMDGNYNQRASMGRAHVACLARFAGIPAAILGFSWSPSPDEGASRELRFAALAGVTLMARDPASYRRLEESNFSNVSLVADLVFTARSIDHAGAARVLEDIGTGAKPFVLVNASGMVQRQVDQTAAYVKFIRVLQRAGLEVVLLPHVSRSSGDDFGPQEAIEAALGAAEVKVVRALLSPATVRGLCARSTIVVTGRMHLGVMALLVGVPPVILSTQGKVEGLYEHFEINRLCVDPRDAFTLDLPDEVEYLLSHLDEYQAQIQSRLGIVQSLAERNFQLRP